MFLDAKATVTPSHRKPGYELAFILFFLGITRFPHLTGVKATSWFCRKCPEVVGRNVHRANLFTELSPLHWALSFSYLTVCIGAWLDGSRWYCQSPDPRVKERVMALQLANPIWKPGWPLGTAGWAQFRPQCRQWHLQHLVPPCLVFKYLWLKHLFLPREMTFLFCGKDTYPQNFTLYIKAQRRN